MSNSYIVSKEGSKVGKMGTNVSVLVNKAYDYLHEVKSWEEFIHINRI